MIREKTRARPSRERAHEARTTNSHERMRRNQLRRLWRGHTRDERERARKMGVSGSSAGREEKSTVFCMCKQCKISHFS